MQLINELAYVIHLDKPKSFDEYIPANSKTKQLFNLITEKGKSDDEAAKIIYGSSSKDKKYLMLKKNLLGKLKELVLLVDAVGDPESYLKVEMECNQQLSIASKLLQLNVFHNAERILRKVLIKAEKYYLVAIQIQTYQLLRKIAYLIPNPNDTHRYNELANHLREERNIELMAKGAHEVLLSQIKSTKSVNKRIISFAKESEQVIKEFSTPNPHILLTLLRIQSIRFVVERKWKKLKNNLNKIDQLIRHYPFIITEQITLEIEMNKVKMLSATKHFKESKKALSKAYTKTSYQAFNVFDFKAEEFDLLLKTGEYEEAGNILREVRNASQFDLLNPIDKASWLVREVNLYFIGSVTAPALHEYVTSFKKGYSLQHFMKATVPLTKDKRGFNLQYLIARIMLIWVSQKKNLTDEGNNLKTYYQRYIKESQQPRTHIFFKKLSRLLRLQDEAKRALVVSQFDEEIANHSNYHEYCEMLPYEVIFHTLAEKADTITE